MARLAVATVLALTTMGMRPLDQDPTPTASESSTSALPGFVPGFGDSQPPVATDEPEVVDDERLPQWPIGGVLGQRLWCIEGFESNHSGLAVNRSSGARGWLQWLPGTARAWGVVVGDRGSEWHAAARIAALGERFFVSQWVPLQRGLC